MLQIEKHGSIVVFKTLGFAWTVNQKIGGSVLQGGHVESLIVRQEN